MARTVGSKNRTTKDREAAQALAASGPGPAEHKLPAEQVIVAQVKRNLAFASKVKDERDAHNEQLKAQVAKHGIVKKALAFATVWQKLNDKDPKLAETFVYHVDHYLDALGARKNEDLFGTLEDRRDFESATGQAPNVTSLHAAG